MKHVFVDTGGFYAFTDADDEFHEKSCTLFEKAATESWRVTKEDGNEALKLLIDYRDKDHYRKG